MFVYCERKSSHEMIMHVMSSERIHLRDPSRGSKVKKKSESQMFTEVQLGNRGTIFLALTFETLTFLSPHLAERELLL